MCLKRYLARLDVFHFSFSSSQFYLNRWYHFSTVGAISFVEILCRMSERAAVHNYRDIENSHTILMTFREERPIHFGFFLQKKTGRERGIEGFSNVHETKYLKYIHLKCINSLSVCSLFVSMAKCFSINCI